ncbi:MAG: hypothetical protein D3911_13695 [Candidatus Electrothrix sp. AW3_4]|nr:hypothetical protein [Candidatus Electrothrix gigas]
MIYDTSNSVDNLETIQGVTLYLEPIFHVISYCSGKNGKNISSYQSSFDLLHDTLCYPRITWNTLSCQQVAAYNETTQSAPGSYGNHNKKYQADKKDKNSHFPENTAESQPQSCKRTP